MSYLYVKPKKKYLVELPHYVLVNDQVLGLVKGQVVRIHLPAGSYKVTVRSVYKFIEGSAMVEVGDDETVTCMVSDHEKWWNILFNVDLILWAAKRFVNIGEPWDTVYEVASNGFFAIWLLRLWIIRKRYFKIAIHSN